MTEHPAPVYVQTLDVRGFKRLHAVTIHADGPRTVLLTGKNRQGKSSILDALWATLQWTTVTRAGHVVNPVHDGADEAVSVLTLSNGLIVTRTWTAAGGMRLVVKGEDGKEKKSPKRVLDDLLGELTFDPLQFAAATERGQYELLTKAVHGPVDLAELDRLRSEKFAARTAARRRSDDLAAVAATAPNIPDDTPDEDVDAAAILAAVRAGDATNATLDAHERDVVRARQDLTDAETRLAEAQAAVRAAEGRVTDLGAASFDLPYRVDTAPLLAQLDTVQDTNRAVRAKQDHARAVAAADQARQEWSKLDQDVRVLDESKRTAVAEAQLPVDGLSFDAEGRVTFHEKPLVDCSGAQRVEVSVAIAMALNPRLRVIRLTDAAILDTESREAVSRMAEANGYQMWLECADDGDSQIPGALVIEDGRVRADAVV